LLLQGLLAAVEQAEAQHFGRELKRTLMAQKEDLLDDATVLALLGQVAVYLRAIAAELEA
jgi:hypothetical protein